jgi:beta-lactamase superfamily II metal-dependent hydrolase
MNQMTLEMKRILKKIKDLRHVAWVKAVAEYMHEFGKATVLGCLLLVLGITIHLTLGVISPKELRVSFLDIGQGDAILIQTPSGKDMLIDGGASDVVLERLSNEMSYFDRDIDVVVATHPDADHVTGLIPVLTKYDVKKIITSPRDGDTGIFADLDRHINNEMTEVHVAHTGDVIDFGDGVSARILFPPRTYDTRSGDTNDASVSMVLTYGEHTFLLTGDLPTLHEDELIRAGLPRNITVYKAGHHGSKYSSGEQLLTYIHPEYAVISAGKDNKYGHPNPEALERLQKYSKEILSTIDKGTITFVTDGRLPEVKTSK